MLHEHETPTALEPEAMSTPSLTSLLDSVPESLRNELRDAVVEARVQRVERIADAIDEISADAANQIRELVRDFRYDDLVHALTKCT